MVDGWQTGTINVSYLGDVDDVRGQGCAHKGMGLAGVVQKAELQGK